MHRSATDPEAKLYRKGDGVGAFLCYSGHAITENRHGLVMSVRVDDANGRAERENTLAMLDHLERHHDVHPATLGADKGTWARWSARQGQRRARFRKSQRRRKLVEEFFGWAKTVAGMRRARHVGREKIRQCFELAAAAYNLVRMKNLLARYEGRSRAGGAGRQYSGDLTPASIKCSQRPASAG